MFAIVDTETREVLEILENRPKTNTYQAPLLSVYITSAEAAQLSVPNDKWVKDQNDPYVSNRVHIPGTIVSAATLQGAVDRQGGIKVRLQEILTFAQSINNRAFSTLTTNELKGLLQLMFAMNGMIDINGNVDLSDFTVDRLVKSIL